jgi:hypothetical protein
VLMFSASAGQPGMTAAEASALAQEAARLLRGRLQPSQPGPCSTALPAVVSAGSARGGGEGGAGHQRSEQGNGRERTARHQDGGGGTLLTVAGAAVQGSRSPTPACPELLEGVHFVSLDSQHAGGAAPAQRSGGAAGLAVGGTGGGAVALLWALQPAAVVLAEPDLSFLRQLELYVASRGPRAAPHIQVRPGQVRPGRGGCKLC